MANYNLAGQKIKNTYQQVAQVSGSTLLNGSGTATPIATSSIVNFPTEVSRSAAAAGFGGGGSIDTSSLTPLSTFNAYTSSNDSVVDALVAATSSYLTSLPSGLVSSSAQISYTGITDVPSGIVSGAAQLPEIGTNTSNIASLTAATSSYLTSLPSGVISSSAQVDLASAYGTAATATSASYALTASYVAGIAAPGLVAGSGTDSMRSSATLTTTSPTASGNYSIALGNSAKTAAANSIAIGNGAFGDYVMGGNISGSIAIGRSAYVAASNGIALGSQSWVNGSDLYTINGIAIGSRALVGSRTTATISAANGIAIGRNAEASSDDSIAIGNGAYNANRDGNRQRYISIGKDANSITDGIALGSEAKSRGTENITIGAYADAAGFRAVSIGPSAQSHGQYSVALGYNVQAYANNGLAIGSSIQANNYNSETNINGLIIYNNDNKEHCKITHTIVAPTNTLTGAGSTVTPNGSQSNFWFLANGGSTTTVANPTNIADGTTYVFKITNGQNITWGTAYKWEGGSPPTLTSGTDIVTFVSIGGSELYGTAILNLS